MMRGDMVTIEFRSKSNIWSLYHFDIIIRVLNMTRLIKLQFSLDHETRQMVTVRVSQSLTV